MNHTVDATGLNEAEVLAELYNSAKPFGMGIYQYKVQIITTEEAERELTKTKYFDYLHGRSMKIGFEKYPELNTWGYDRDYGVGAVQKCVDNVKSRSLTVTIPRSAPTETELKETLDACNKGITITSLPIYSGKPIASLQLNKFDKVWFDKSFCDELKTLGVPYPDSWHMFMGKDDDTNEAQFAGSMGGRFVVGLNLPVVTRSESL